MPNKKSFDAPLSFVHWDITSRCNLKCIHCRDTFDITKKDEELTTQEGFDLIDYLADNFNLKWLSFDGGEPLLREDLIALIKKAKSRSLLLYLLTNGTLLTEDKAKQLKKAGLDSIQISLDGLEKNHDKIRGKGTYKKALEGIKNAKKFNIRVTARITINSINIGDAAKLLKVVKELGCPAFGIRRVIPCGNAIKNIDLMEPDKKEYLETIQKCIQLAGKDIHVQIGADPVLIPRTYMLEEIKSKYGTDQVIAGCGAGITMCHISNVGNVFPCSTLPISAGNIRHKNLKEIWQKGEIFLKLREGRSKLKGKCGKCNYNYICGGCRASAYYYKKDVLGEDPYCLLNV